MSCPVAATKVARWRSWDLPGGLLDPDPTQQALRTLEWVHRRENLVVCGPSGLATLTRGVGGS